MHYEAQHLDLMVKFQNKTCDDDQEVGAAAASVLLLEKKTVRHVY